MGSVKQTIKRIPGIGPVARRAYGMAQSRFPRLFARDPFHAWRDVQKHLRFAVEYVYSAEVEGDIVEFGTMSGKTAETIATAMIVCDRLQLRRPKTLYLFDSFEGLPAIVSKWDQQSTHVKSGVWRPGGCKMLSKAELLKRLARHRMSGQRVHVYDGWYRETVPTVPPETRFAMLHVDCDLYQSTMEALEPLFAKGLVAEGALVLFDDWYCNRASPDQGEQRAWAELTSRFCIKSSDLGGYGWAGRKFIAHSYRSAASTHAV